MSALNVPPGVGTFTFPIPFPDCDFQLSPRDSHKTSFVFFVFRFFLLFLNLSGYDAERFLAPRSRFRLPLLPLTIRPCFPPKPASVFLLAVRTGLLFSTLVFTITPITVGIADVRPCDLRVRMACLSLASRPGSALLGSVFLHE